MHAPPLPPDLVDGLFRHRYGQLVAQLCKVLGPGRLDLCEDMVQEAVLRALRTWPASGVPDDPTAWLFRVARNAAFDALRRQRIGTIAHERLAEDRSAAAPPPEPPAIADDTLRLLFVCAHPDVPADARVPLLLKTVCGLGVPAIARGLLLGEAAVAQRLVRAKAKLQQGVPFAYHVEAAIASVHAAAPTYADTDWARILAHYDDLVALSPSGVVRLNRAVAVAKVHGAAAGLQALAELGADRSLADYALLHAVKAQLHWERSDHAAAAAALRMALSSSMSDPERRLLERRLAACERGEAVGPW